MPAIIGHQWAIDLLSRQLAQGLLAHAYLFTGAPQVGKGTLARWFAQALLCQAPAGQPCGTCPDCQKAAAGRHPDVRLLNLEVQPGERRTLGIEAIRELRSGMAERPFAGRRKVYLIEDAETMTPEAANALLKTLEEPPPFVVLLLVALSDHMLLETIVSRCQMLPLRVLSRPEVRRALVEGWGASPEQADLFAALSCGRPGWAIQALQASPALERREENLAALQRLLEAGLLDRFSFAEQQEQRWRRGDPGAVFDVLECWQGWWRDVQMVCQGCPELVVNIDRQEGMRAVARQLAPERARHVLHALGAARQQLHDQVNPRLVFEELLLQMPTVVA